LRSCKEVPSLLTQPTSLTSRLPVDNPQEFFALFVFTLKQTINETLERHIFTFDWLDNEFPEWELVDAEHQLYESIEGEDVSFKGFVDCLLKCKDKKGNELLWVIDWKTTGKAGWLSRKRRDFLATAQVGLYKRYISRKLNIDLKDIRCAYVFLKRGAKPDKCIDTFTVSVGPKFVERVDKLVSAMVKNVKKGFALRNYNSCKFCPFANSEHCNGGQW